MKKMKNEIWPLSPPALRPQHVERWRGGLETTFHKIYSPARCNGHHHMRWICPPSEMGSSKRPPRERGQAAAVPTTEPLLSCSPSTAQPATAPSPPPPRPHLHRHRRRCLHHRLRRARCQHLLQRRRIACVLAPRATIATTPLPLIHLPPPPSPHRCPHLRNGTTYTLAKYASK